MQVVGPFNLFQPPFTVFETVERRPKRRKRRKGRRKDFRVRNADALESEKRPSLRFLIQFARLFRAERSLQYIGEERDNIFERP